MDYKSEDQISAKKKQKRFTIDWNKLLNFKMILLEWYLKPNTNKIIENVSEYQLLKKCFKGYQQYSHK